MKYTVDTLIDMPVKDVYEKFENIENRKHWQPGLLSMHHLSGTPGNVGVKMQLEFLMNKRKMLMEETMISKKENQELGFSYQANNVFNTVVTRFEDKDGKTLLSSENEFVFSGFMKVVGFLFKSSFPKQSSKYMADFKAFAEEGKSLLNE